MLNTQSKVGEDYHSEQESYEQGQQTPDKHNELDFGLCEDESEFGETQTYMGDDFGQSDLYIPKKRNRRLLRPG